MLQPKRKLTRTLTRKSTSRPMTEEEKKKWGTQLEDAGQRYPSDGKKRLTPTYKLERTSKIEKRSTPQLKTKKATAVDNPMPKTERVAQSFAKPKMKTLKGKIQLALMKAKKG
jgi:hypothetical protein